MFLLSKLNVRKVEISLKLINVLTGFVVMIEINGKGIWDLSTTILVFSVVISSFRFLLKLCLGFSIKKIFFDSVIPFLR